MKAIISNKIYLQVTNEQREYIVDELTYRIEVAGGATGKKRIDVIRNYSLPKSGIIAIPQGRLDLVPEGHTIEDKRVLVPVEFPDPKFQLRDAQQPVWDIFDDTGFLNAKVGWGKTYTALHLAMKFGQKTLIVCHNTLLRDQWIQDVRNMFGIEPGVIGSGQFDLEPIIVVGNIQTLTKHTTTLADKFGTVIMDEAHHCVASTFTVVVDSSKARYRIALSGTLKRKDGKHILFKDYFGPTVHTPPQSDTINPVIKIIKTGIPLKPSVCWADKITDLLTNPDYIDFVADIAEMQANKGHKVLIVADRTEFLKSVQSRLGDRCILIIGDTEFEDRNRAKAAIENEEADVIAGARSIFSEGISINPLSCLILANPYSSEILLEQLIGRIQRLYPGKLQPIVIDLQPKNSKQNGTRIMFYMDQSWKVDYV